MFIVTRTIINTITTNTIIAPTAFISAFIPLDNIS